MATTTLQDVALGVRGIGGRTDFAGAAVTDLSAEEDRFINVILDEGYIKPATAFEVNEGAAATMNVVVGSNAAKADYYVVEGVNTGQGNYIVRLEGATETFALSAADPSLARKDAIYIVVQDDAYDSSSRAVAVLAVRKGDAAASPSAPGPDAAWDAYALLATVDVPSAASDIIACTINDERVAASTNLRSLDSATGGHDHDADYLGIVDTAYNSDRLGNTYYTGYSTTAHNHDSDYASTDIWNDAISMQYTSVLDSSGTASAILKSWTLTLPSGWGTAYVWVDGHVNIEAGNSPEQISQWLLKIRHQGGADIGYGATFELKTLGQANAPTAGGLVVISGNTPIELFLQHYNPSGQWHVYDGFLKAHLIRG